MELVALIEAIIVAAVPNRRPGGAAFPSAWTMDDASSDPRPAWPPATASRHAPARGSMLLTDDERARLEPRDR